jgi:uncharacterized cofD-like protein
VKGVPEVIKKSKAKKVYICNLMTKFGETNNFKAIDFVNEVEKYLGKDILDFVILNKKRPPEKILKKYRKNKAFFVEYSKEDFKDKKFKIVKVNLLRGRELLRHDSKKIAKVIYSLK